jgi:hypothetical protein
MNDNYKNFAKYYTDFFDYMSIRSSMFKNIKNLNDIDSLLNDNKSVLFYHEIYLSDDDKKLFDNMYAKYILLIKDNFENDNILEHLNSKLFRKLTDTYYYISPSIICDIIDEHNCDENAIIAELNKIRSSRRQKLKIFKHNFDTILNAYISNINYDQPYPTPDEMRALVNMILVEVIKIMDALICDGIYTLNYLISNEIDVQFGLNDFFQLELPNNRPLLII